jgi:hypothetical protein
MSRPCVFLLSPASCQGERARILLRPEARFELARRIRTRSGAPLGEVFAFLSGLYFRGKLTYASRFARAPEGGAGTWIITANRGLVPPELSATARLLRSFNDVPIDVEEPRYARPLLKSAKALRASLGADCDVVLLGSVASGKYVELLLPIFGERLKFPECFVGRGDMSRGGVLLRAVETGTELSYAPIGGATLRGRRAEKLPPKPRRRAEATDSAVS